VDGLKFSVTVIFPAEPGNMTLIQRILTEFPNCPVSSMENGDIATTITGQMDGSFAGAEFQDLIDIVAPVFIDAATDGFYDLGKVADITGDLSLTLRLQRKL
jgi:hypothetical protein